MKTTAKWISENNYILNNSKYLNIAVSDPLKRQDNYEVNCLDLVLMGLAGCVTAEFKKQICSQKIILKGIETDVKILNLQEEHPNFSIHILCKIKSNAKIEFLKKSLDTAIESSFLGILFEKAGIMIESDIAVIPLNQYAESYVS